MRRFLYIVITSVLVLFAEPLYAQLNIKSEPREAVLKIGTLRSTYSFVYVQGASFFLSIRSSNQFDSPTLFFLGDSAESAILTLKDLSEVCEALDINASISVEDAKEQGALLIKKKILGKPYLDISMDGQAGTSNIALAEIKKAIVIIQAFSGQ